MPPPPQASNNEPNLIDRPDDGEPSLPLTCCSVLMLRISQTSSFSTTSYPKRKSAPPSQDVLSVHYGIHTKQSWQAEDSTTTKTSSSLTSWSTSPFPSTAVDRCLTPSDSCCGNRVSHSKRSQRAHEKNRRNRLFQMTFHVLLPLTTIKTHREDYPGERRSPPCMIRRKRLHGSCSRESRRALPCQSWTSIAPHSQRGRSMRYGQGRVWRNRGLRFAVTNPSPLRSRDKG